jgi:hypothetical protein
MSKFLKVLALAALIIGAGAFAVMPGPAMAQHHHGGYHGGGHWHGGGYRGGWGPGFGFGFGFGSPYYYGDPYYSYGPEPSCGWVRVRVRYHRHWVLRRAWRCW